MGYGVYRVFLGTMAAAGTTATFNTTRAFSRVYLEVASMVSSSALDLYAGSTSTAYYQVRRETASTTTVQNWSFIVAATAVVNGGIIPLPPGLQFYKVIATDSAPVAAIGMNLICGDD